MDIRVDRTPNPAAMKFTLGVPVGGPATYKDPTEAPEYASRILAMDGVVSVFATSDFVTVTADPAIDWASVTPGIVEVLAEAFT